MLEQCYVIYFGFLHIYQRNYLKLVWTCCDAFEQVNGGCLISYVFNCMGGFVINNVSLQGKNVKTKLNLNVEEICRE